MKFRIAHLFAIVTGFAAIFALIEWSVLAAISASVVILGPTIAHATSGETSALVTGFFSAAFWAIAATTFAIPFLVVSDYFIIEALDSRWVISIPIAASMIGGYVGGRLALH